MFDLVQRREQPRETVIAEALRHDLAQIETTVLQSPYWLQKCAEIRHFAETDNPLHFTRWPPISETLQPHTTAAIVAAYLAVRRSRDWRRVWRPVLRHPRYGGAPPFLPFPAANPITIQHVGHLHYFREVVGQSFFDVECVIEFGGGYGSMCRIADRLGFRGDYIVFDQPVVLCLQRYFLALHGIGACYGDGEDRVKLYSRLPDVSRFVAERKPARIAAISTWALSEMPMQLRNEIEPVLRPSDRILLSYQQDFEENDNGQYFERLMTRLDNFRWQRFEIPFYAGNYYAFALRC